MTYIINGKEVEYLHIQNSLDGSITVTYSEKFNLVEAHMSEIMKRLRQNNLNHSLVFKDLKHRIISITYRETNDINGILHIFNIPYGAYEVLEDDKIIVVDVDNLSD